MKQTNRILSITLEILFPLLCFGSVFFLTQNLLAAGIILVLSACQSFFLEWQTRKEQAYWSNIAAQLSDLCDCLLSLKHREIFSRNEDTIFSKLQDKVLKLVTILQQKNEDSLQAQENMKGLISDLSHQLKTPIASLKLYTALLEEPTADRTAAKAIYRSAPNGNRPPDFLVRKHDSTFSIGKRFDSIAAGREKLESNGTDGN